VDWVLAVVALGVLVVAAVSRRLTGTPVTAPMVFVAIGLVAGPSVLDAFDVPPTGAAVKTLAEATLALVLFADAARMDLRALRTEFRIPARLLGIGLPLTILAGALAAALVFPALSFTEALVLSVLLAPTDAALGQAVVTEPRLPSRIRQGLNVESGLNDGICVPLLLIVLATAETEADLESGHHALTVVVEEIGYGTLGGVAAGVLAAAVVVLGLRRDLIARAWLTTIPVAAAGLAYGIAAPLGGSGFIAAFVAGMVFGAAVRRDIERITGLDEELGALLNGVTLLAFGAVLLGPALGDLSWQIVLYAVASLTVVRMLPVALALWGTGARRPTVAFVGWFGPRGLASIVFALIVVQEADLPGTETILLATYATIGLSVLAHGITAAPFADRYSAWYERHPRAHVPPMESGPAPPVRVRGEA
jgi:sodium/hydrogen antiporter